MANYVSMFVNLKAAKTHIHEHTHTHTHTRLSLYSMIQSFGHLPPYINITFRHKIGIIIIIIAVIIIVVVNLPYT
jgi:uncharacterized membrane protein YoaK (UPF0700 family)